MLSTGFQRYGNYGVGGYGGYNSYSGYGGYGGYGGMYGNNMYGGYNRYGPSMYSGGMYGGGMYGGGMYGGPNMYGSPMGMRPYDPNNPQGSGSGNSEGLGWQSLLRSLQGVMMFFGRLSFLVDENTQAMHFFITALLQLFDRAGVLYGELSRFLLKFLRLRRRDKLRGGGKDNRQSQQLPQTQQPGMNTVMSTNHTGWGGAYTGISPIQAPPGGDLESLWPSRRPSVD